MSDTELQEKLFEAHRQWFSRCGAGDVEWFDGVLADDAHLVNNEAQHHGKEGFFRRIRNVTTLDQRVWDLEGSRFGDVFIVRGCYMLHASIQIEGATEYHLYSNRFVAVWKQVEQDDWKVWHFQATENPTVPHASRAYAGTLRDKAYL